MDNRYNVFIFYPRLEPSLYKITIGAYKKIFKNCSSLKSLNKLKQTKLECSFDGSSIQDGHLPQEIIWFRIQGKNDYFVLLFLAEIWLNPNCTWIIIGWTHTIFFVCINRKSKINCHHRTLFNIEHILTETTYLYPNYAWISRWTSSIWY